MGKRGKCRLLQIHDLKEYKTVGLARPGVGGDLQFMDLKMGDILVLLYESSAKLFPNGRNELVLPNYRQLSHELENIFDTCDRGSLGQELYRRALLGLGTDVVINFTPSSETTTDLPMVLHAHKTVLSTVPYFRTMFSSGLKESQTSASSSVALECPSWVAPRCYQTFLTYLSPYRCTLRCKRSVLLLNRSFRRGRCIRSLVWSCHRAPGNYEN